MRYNYMYYNHVILSVCLSICMFLVLVDRAYIVYYLVYWGYKALVIINSFITFTYLLSLFKLFEIINFLFEKSINNFRLNLENALRNIFKFTLKFLIRDNIFDNICFLKINGDFNKSTIFM